VRYTLPISFAIVKGSPVKDTIPDATTSNKGISDPSNKSFYPKIQDTSQRSGTTLIGLDTQMNPLYVLDGKEVANLNNVNPENIESVTVLKQKSNEDLYVTLYGKKALNGVVVIKTKNTVQKQMSAH
jgi:outer membrane receptor protein involved in Fe transport